MRLCLPCQYLPPNLAKNLACSELFRKEQQRGKH